MEGSDLRDYFNLLPMTFSFFIPAITMRLFAEEKNVGSYETLLTMPVSFTHIALGKFLAATAFAAAMLLPTLSYPLFISAIGELDPGPVIGGYLGAILLAGTYCSMGPFRFIFDPEPDHCLHHRMRLLLYPGRTGPHGLFHAPGPGFHGAIPGCQRPFRQYF